MYVENVKQKKDMFDGLSYIRDCRCCYDEDLELNPKFIYDFYI